jgi:hypothetical protein
MREGADQDRTNRTYNCDYCDGTGGVGLCNAVKCAKNGSSEGG